MLDAAVVDNRATQRMAEDDAIGRAGMGRMGKLLDMICLDRVLDESWIDKDRSSL